MEPVAKGPVDANFARWWRLNGENMPGYVARCRNFMRDRLTAGVLHLRHDLYSDQRAFDRDLACLIHDIRLWMFENSRVTFGLERLQDAPAFTSKERREFNAEMALYRRADAGRRLVKAHFHILNKLQLVDNPRLIEARLNAVIRALGQWLAETPEAPEGS
jgi:hypothetical protein